MKMTNKEQFARLEKKIEANGKYSLAFLGVLLLVEGLGDFLNLKYAFLNSSAILVLISFSFAFIGSLMLQSKGAKLKTAQFIAAYQFTFLLTGGILFFHFYLVQTGTLPF